MVRVKIGRFGNDPPSAWLIGTDIPRYVLRSKDHFRLQALKVDYFDICVSPFVDLPLDVLDDLIALMVRFSQHALLNSGQRHGFGDWMGFLFPLVLLGRHGADSDA